MTESIGPDDKVVIMSGTGVPSPDFIRAFINAAIPKGFVIDTRSAEGYRAYDEIGSSRVDASHVPKITNPERDAWNAAIDQKKADKKARKASK